MSTFLVTGGAGFIGSNFVHYLYNNYPDSKIIVLDILTYAGSIDNLPEKPSTSSKRLEFWYGDVCNAALVENLVSRADYVIHFAAETHVTRSIFDNKKFFETDILGTQTVANAVLEHKNRVRKFIHISTSEVYGSDITHCSVPMSEEHPLNPSSPYAAAKCGADRLVYSYMQTYDIPAVIVRPFNNYGPRQHLEKVLPRFITGVIMNEDLKVHGEGMASRDWIDVRDTCEALNVILNADIDKIKGEVFNIGTNRTIKIRDLAQKVVKEMNYESSRIKYIAERPGQVDCHIANVEKIKNILGWESKIFFEDGLKNIIEWYKNNRSFWEKQIWMREVPIILKNGEKVLH